MQKMHTISFQQKSHSRQANHNDINMNSCLILIVLISTALCAPQSSSKDARILKYEHDVAVGGGYNFAYETSDGISRQEVAELKNPGSKEEILAIRGSYSWIDAEGRHYVVNYVADENGFHPEGEHLPQ